LFSWPSSFELASSLYEQFGPDAKLLSNGEQVRLVRFEEADQRREERGIAGPAPKLLCPDSGQLDEPLSPAGFPERCCKR